MIIKRKNILALTIIACISSVIIGIIISWPTHAAMGSIPQKWIFSQYYNCFQSELLSRNLVRAKNGFVADSIFKNNSAILDYNHLPSEGYFTSVGATSLTSLGNTDSISCRQVLTGIDGKISGVLEAAGVKYDVTWESESITDDVLGKLGYKAKNGDTVVTFRVVMKRDERDESSGIVHLFEGGKVVTETTTEDVSSARIQGTKDADGNVTWKVVESNLFKSLKVNIDKSNKLTITYDAPNSILEDLGNVCHNVPKDVVASAIQLPNNIDEDAIKQINGDIRKEIGTLETSYYCDIVNTQFEYRVAYYREYFDIEEVNSGIVDAGYGTEFTNDGSQQTALQSLIALGHSFSTLKLSEDEIYDLYSWYLDKAIPGGIQGDRTKCQDYKDSDSLKNGLQEIHLKNSDKWYKYYVNMADVDTATKKYYDLKPGATIEPISLGEIIEWFNSHAAEDLPDSCTPPETSDGEANTTVTDRELDEVDCWNSAGALGWILCPVIDFAHHTIVAVYDSIVQNFLEFRADFLEIRGDNAVYTAWQTFQSFANVAFVIVLLIVIFSQLTGVGIDNLGIKRVLPKLIIAAVLINLSYLICMLFVDISNILGVGLNNLFSNIVVAVDGQTAAGATGAAVLSTVMTAVVGAAVGALAVGGVVAGISGAVIVLPLVLGLIGALIGVLFFFILLGLRQALIIMLIIVSPVAVACYMLPNTKTIFNKWLKLFEALLLLFPICGLIMGGSAFASDILMTMDTGFLGKLIAMLVGVVPFFFIPTLLKSSMAAAGNIGGKISGLGQSLSRGARGKVANSQWAKDYQARSAAGIDKSGKQTALGKWRSNIASGNSRFSKVPGMQAMARRSNARAQSARVKYLEEKRREDRFNEPGYFENYERSQEMALDKEQLNAAIDVINKDTQNGENQTDLFRIYDEAIAGGDTFRARAVAEIAGRRKDTANAFIEKFKNDSESGAYAGKDNVMGAVAKQIATGGNSKYYRASNALGFEYASQVVKGDTSDDYGKWKQNEENVHDAIEHHITNGSELYGQSNGSLREIAELATNHQARKSDGSLKVDKNGNPVIHNDQDYLARLAARAEAEGRTSGVYDQTKEDSLATIKGLSPAAAAAASNTSADNRNAKPNQTFDWRHQSNVASPAAELTTEQIQQLEQQYNNDKWTTGFSSNISTDQLNQLSQLYERKIDQRTADKDTWDKYQKVKDELNRRNFQEVQVRRAEQQKEQEQQQKEQREKEQQEFLKQLRRK